MAAPPSLTPFQASYHWRNKNCYPWSAEWFKTEVPGTQVAEGKQSAVIKTVTTVEGDCDLGMRKGKLLTIYDLRVVMEWEGIAADGSEVQGTLTVPEVSHEAIDGLSDYEFEFSSSTTGAAASDLVSFLRKAFPPVLTEKFNSFAPALVAANGDLAPSQSGSGAATPSYAPAPPAPAANEEKKPVKESAVGNTAAVSVEARLQASAEDIWGLLTDEAKIPMWARAPAKISLNPESEYEMFGGGVRGKIVSVDRPNKLVQTWQLRNPSWPAAHYGTMTISLKQGDDSTLVTFNLDGVPKGQEDQIQSALEAYYIRGFKTMGLVLSVSTPAPRASAKLKPVQKPKTSTKGKAKFKSKSRPAQPEPLLSSKTVAVTAMVGLVAAFGALVWQSFPKS